MDDLSGQELKERQSTVNQLTVQIQAGFSHVISHPLIYPSSFEKNIAAIFARSMIHGTSCGTPGNVFFLNPSASDEPTASCSRHVCARSPTATHGEPMSPNTRRSDAKMDGVERTTQNFAIPTPRFGRKFSTWNPLSLSLLQKELIRKIT